MSKKYELTSISKVVNGCTIYRIKALKDFGTVKKGDIGGYIQSSINLSQEDDCWIFLIMLKYLIMLKHMEMLKYLIMQ